jgi:MOB kinase activator 1
VKAALVKGNFKTIVALPKCSFRQPLLQSKGASFTNQVKFEKPVYLDVDVNEWVAVNRALSLLVFRASHSLTDYWLDDAVVDLFNNLNLFYSVVTEFCTVENNPTMSAGPG